MPLFTDNDLITRADLLAVDPEVTDVAEAESIVVDGPSGIIRQAWNECADKVQSAMDSFGGSIGFDTAAFTGSALGISTPRVRLSQICATPQYAGRTTPLVRWMLYRALFLLYRAASNRRDVDRYDRKTEQYEKDAKDQWRILFQSGLPVVSSFLSCPAAEHEMNSGTWSAANLTAVAGGSQPDSVSYDVAITWVDASLYQSQTAKGNAESGPSTVQAITIAAANVLRVDIGTLVPPGSLTDQSGLAEGVRVALRATGWNLYVGLSGGTLYLQNSSPIALGTTVSTLANAPTLSGYPLWGGQAATANYTFQNIVGRG